MPDDAPKPSTPPPAQPAKAQPAPERAGHPSMAEEFDRAKWTLPPLVPVLIGLAVVAIVVAFFAFALRSKPAAVAEITSVYAGELPNVAPPSTTPETDQATSPAPESNATTMVAIQVHFKNATDKPIWIHNLSAKLNANGKDYEDTAAAPQDYERYAQAVPGMPEHLGKALLPEMKIPVGGDASGTVLVTFPVDKATFDKRNKLAVVLDLYDENPVIIPEKK